LIFVSIFSEKQQVPTTVNVKQCADYTLHGRRPTYRVPLIVVELFPIDLECTTSSTASCKRQLTLAQIGAHHVRQIRVLRQKYQTGSRMGPKFDVQAVSAHTTSVISF